MRVRVRDIDPNPFRRVDHYPLDDAKLEALQSSIQSTGFWDNVVARKNGRNDRAELAYGHHRLEALKRVVGPDSEINLIIKPLSNDAMLRIMAEENLAEWAHDFGVEAATIQAVLEAAKAGAITLPAKNTNGAQVEFDAQSLAAYLGGNWSEPRVRRCLQVLDVIGEETPEILSGTSPVMANEIVQTAKAVVLGSTRPTDQRPPNAPERRRIVKETRKLAAQVAAGTLKRAELRQMRGKLPGDQRAPLKTIKTVNVSEAVRKIGYWIDEVLSENDNITIGLNQLTAARNQWSADDYRILTSSLRLLQKRADEVLARIERKELRS